MNNSLTAELGHRSPTSVKIFLKSKRGLEEFRNDHFSPSASTSVNQTNKNITSAFTSVTLTNQRHPKCRCIHEKRNFTKCGSKVLQGCM